MKFFCVVVIFFWCRVVRLLEALSCSWGARMFVVCDLVGFGALQHDVDKGAHSAARCTLAP